MTYTQWLSDFISVCCNVLYIQALEDEDDNQIHNLKSCNILLDSSDNIAISIQDQLSGMKFERRWQNFVLAQFDTQTFNMYPSLGNDLNTVKRLGASIKMNVQNVNRNTFTEELAHSHLCKICVTLDWYVNMTEMFLDRAYEQTTSKHLSTYSFKMRDFIWSVALERVEAAYSHVMQVENNCDQSFWPHALFRGAFRHAMGMIKYGAGGNRLEDYDCGMHPRHPGMLLGGFYNDCDDVFCLGDVHDDDTYISYTFWIPFLN